MISLPTECAQCTPRYLYYLGSFFVPHCTDGWNRLDHAKFHPNADL